jgi:uncharacterized membrane protein
MINLVAAAIFFLGIHLFISGTSLRGTLIRTIGEKAYMAYNATDNIPNRLYWVAPAALVHAAPLVMVVAFLFAVIGLTTPNPTALGATAVLDKPDAIKGMLRITRHPFLWAVILWSALHIGLNGDRASIIFFGTFLFLAALGTLAIDGKRKAELGDKWTSFAAQTSNLPFAAIIAGRNRLGISELGWWRILLGLVAFGALFYGHLYLFGVSPVPGWVPY